MYKKEIYIIYFLQIKKRLKTKSNASIIKDVISEVYFFLYNMKPPIIHKDIKT